MFQAIIFDFDGTIVDSEPLHFQAVQSIFTSLGVFLEADLHQQECIGYPDFDNFKRLSAKFQLHLDDSALQQLVDKKIDFFHQLAKDSARPCKGVIPLIKKVAQQFPLAICTSSHKTDVDNILPQLDEEDISRYFKHIITLDDVVIGKPDPACYRLAAQQLNILPQYCLAIEDSPAGIIAAKTAGMTVLAVTTTHPQEKLTLADYCTNSLEDLNLNEIFILSLSTARIASLFLCSARQSRCSQ